MYDAETLAEKLAYLDGMLCADAYCHQYGMPNAWQTVLEHFAKDKLQSFRLGMLDAFLLRATDA